MGGADLAERKKLVLFTNSVQVGGMEEHVRLLAKELDRRRFSVCSIFPAWPETDSFAARVAEVADQSASFSPDRRFGLVKALKETVRLYRFARQQRFDVAHLHSTTYNGLWLALLAFRAARVPRIVVTEHLAPETKPSLVIRVRQLLLSWAITSLVCVSERNRQSRVEFLHTPAASTHVVVNGIDLTRFAAVPEPAEVAATRTELGIPVDAKVVGTVIRLEPGKGVSDLIDAFEIVRRKHDDAVLLIVGDGSLRSRLEAHVDDLGVRSSVVFAGFISDPRAMMQAMDVFVLPVPFGSASIALLEAMALSRPSIITFGGPGEAIEHGDSGFFAEPSNPASIAEYVCHLLDDDDERAQVARRARERVEQSFSSARVAEELADIYLGQAG